MTSEHKALTAYKSVVLDNFNKLKELMLSEQFLAGFTYDDSISTHVITDLEKAIDIYTDEDYPGHTAMTYLFPEYSYSNYMCYDENLANEDVQWDKVDEFWRDICSETWDFTVKTLQTPKFDWLEKTGNLMDIADFIHSDIYTILSFTSSTDSQKEGKFLEEQLKVYQNGGFPCGWYGKYPEGQIIVYSPK